MTKYSIDREGAHKLEAAMRERGLSRVDIGNELGCHCTTVGRLLTGKTCVAKAMWVGFAEACGITFATISAHLQPNLNRVAEMFDKPGTTTERVWVQPLGHGSSLLTVVVPEQAAERVRAVLSKLV